MQGRLLIVANGDLPEKELCESLVESAETIVACDGGISHIIENGWKVNAIIGDLDSLPDSFELEDALEMGITVLPRKDQNTSDIAKALKWAEDESPHDWQQIDVIGVSGGRLDHQFATWMSLCEAESSATIHLENWSIIRASKETRTIMDCKIGSILAVFAIGQTRGVELSGCVWPLTNADLQPSTQGVHNEICESEFSISCAEGHLICMWQRG